MGADGKATIARQNDCQTCLLCELYCPADDLFVWPDYEAPVGITAAQASGQLGAFRRDSGWGEHAGRFTNQHWRMGGIFERARQAALPQASQRPAPPQV